MVEDIELFRFHSTKWLVTIEEMQPKTWVCQPQILGHDTLMCSCMRCSGGPLLGTGLGDPPGRCVDTIKNVLRVVGWVINWM